VPKLRRPDGVEIHWESRGGGSPPVICCHPCFSVPSAFTGLGDELARDHRVISYDPRGTGRSTRSGPHDIPTDAEDLAALLDELGEPVVLVAFGDALHRSAEAAAARPQLVVGVVSPGMAVLGAQSSYSGVGEGLASSPAVVGALVQLLESDYRSGLRTVVEGGNPQFSEREVQERIEAVIEHAPQEVTLDRLRSWIERDSREAGRALGDRLWMLLFPGNIWFPEELPSAIRRELPDAHFEHVADGAISRPDLTAEVIRRITRC
jgi:pimeloyl-ACP methyl ester carboxylesterase